MTNAPRSTKLLRYVGWRLHVQAFARSLYWWLMAATCVYATLLLISRATGYAADYFTGMTFALVPAVAVAGALLSHRRPVIRDAARAVDAQAGSRDLYLTLSLLDHAYGEYQPLVIQSAEERAERIDPTVVVPWRWSNRVWHSLLVPAVVALALVFLPQWDPFGRVAAASLTSQREARLVESRRETQLRVAAMKQAAEEEADEPTETEFAIDKLKLALNKMQPQQPRENFESLMDEQKQLGQVWQKLSSEQLKNLLKSAEQQQQFGSDNQEMLRKWSEDLKNGLTESMKKELEDLKEELQKLAKTQDPVEREKQRQQLQERLERLEKFAEQNLEAKELAASLQRAMQQMDLSKLDDLSQEALEAALESMELSEMELDQLQQSAQDLKNLEDALKTLQMAKKLNEREKLDGRKTQGKKSLQDYAELYKQMMAEMSECQGEGKCEGCAKCDPSGKKRGKGKSGMKGPGTGEGGEAPENDSIQNEFQTELSKSAVTAGKILMSMKDKGLGERGQDTRDYRNLIERVRQGASEALLQEQIPPGYHESIKSYFDTLEANKPK